MIQKYAGIIICFVFLNYFGYAQAWKLKLSSNVELRTWKLTTKADKEEKALGGASIKLLSGTSVVNEITSKPNGDFTIEVPANGEFMLEVSYAGCNTKRFAISTKDVPDKVANDNFKPSYSIGGFIMARPFSGIDYTGLKNPLLKVEYQSGSQKFDNDGSVTNSGLKTVSKIGDAEAELFDKFCNLNKAGDAALSKNDCPLAKTNYEKALALLGNEAYPTAQLVKTAECFKQKEAQQKDADKKAIADAVAKAAADKAAKEQAESDKLVKAQAQSAQKKAAEEKKAEGKVKPAAPAQEAPKQTSTATVSSVPTPTVKGGLKIKPKSEEELALEAKQAKQREGMAKSIAEDKEAMQKDADKAKEKQVKRQQEAAERAQKEREGKAAAEAKIIEEDKAEAAKIEERRQKEREGKAAAEAKIIEEDKAEAAKKWEKKQKAEEEREKERQEELAKEREAASKRELEESDRKIPQPLGADKYKEAITKADDFFKMKRYDEAKKMYEEALIVKTGDPYATGKLTEISKLVQPK